MKGALQICPRTFICINLPLSLLWRVSSMGTYYSVYIIHSQVTQLKMTASDAASERHTRRVGGGSSKYIYIWTDGGPAPMLVNRNPLHLQHHLSQAALVGLLLEFIVGVNEAEETR